MFFCRCLKALENWEHTKIIIWHQCRLMGLSRQQDKDQATPVDVPVWVEEGQKFVPWWWPNHRQGCQAVGIQAKPQNWSVFHGAEGKTKNMEKKIILHQKNPRGTFSPFSKAEESRDLWLVMQQQQGDACRGCQLKQKANVKKAVDSAGTRTCTCGRWTLPLLSLSPSHGKPPLQEQPVLSVIKIPHFTSWWLQAGRYYLLWNVLARGQCGIEHPLSRETGI